MSTNILQNVQTYQMSNLAFMLNLACFVSTCNTKFKDFDKFTANLGDTVTYETPPRFVTNDGLVAVFQGTEQNVRRLTVNKAANVAYTFTSQQFIFNVKDYMARFGEGAVHELANKIEADVASIIVPNTYRFYGNGITPINSYGQLAEALALFRNYGAPKDNLKCYLSDIAVPQIVNSGLQQFVMDRNEEIASSWMVGSYDQTMFYRSNLLPIHYAGTVGEAGTILTVVSVSADGSQITLSGAAANDANAIKQYDKLQFQDGVPGLPNLRFTTYIGHLPSANPVQLSITADAASNGSGNVTINVTPALNSTPGDRNQNINVPVQAGMQIKLLPSHREGVIVGGNAFYLAMPTLPDQRPFDTANKADPDTGVSIRLTEGATFGKNELGHVLDAVWGKDLVPQYSMAMIFPL